MLWHILDQNSFLRRPVKAFYDCAYVKPDPNNANNFSGRVSDAIRTLKNQFCKETDSELSRAKNYIRAIATTDLNAIITQNNISNPIIVCVPRSKADFSDKQLFFHKAISEATKNVGATDGSNYIKRITNTKTTHLTNTKRGDMGGDGDMPYPGITKSTCRLDGFIRDKNVILVDDIYTKTVNIDEDCCQYLIDNGVNSVLLYTICKTQLGS